MTRVEAMREATIALVTLDIELEKQEAIRDDVTLPERTRLVAAGLAQTAKAKIEGWEVRMDALKRGNAVEGVE